MRVTYAHAHDSRTQTRKTDWCVFSLTYQVLRNSVFLSNIMNPAATKASDRSSEEGNFGKDLIGAEGVGVSIWHSIRV